MRTALRDVAREQATHPGLILQRYTDLTGSDEARVKQRAEILNRALRCTASTDLHELYREAFDRWSRSFPTEGQRVTRLGPRTGSQLALGLGTSSVLEVGLRLHHTYGTPIIPGSALKGLAASFCHTAWGQAHLSPIQEHIGAFRRGGRYHALLFGTTENSGAIEFHDAWITPESLGTALRLDVMTPHHPKWQLDEAAPSDLDSPVPVSFLSVSGTFDIRLSWAGPSGVPAAQIDAWTALAMHLVIAALDEQGIGGKTRSGYGRLDRIAKAGTTPPPSRPKSPGTGTRVQARLLSEKTNKGGWKAMHVESDWIGPIVNTRDVPVTLMADDIVELIVANSNPKEIGFRYPAGPASSPQPTRTPPKGRSR